MSRNLSQTLFYEFHKSDPNLIYQSVEEYRSYKLDPNFADKTLEEYRRFKALEKRENTEIEEKYKEESLSEEEEEDESLCGTQKEHLISGKNEEPNMGEADNANRMKENLQVGTTELKIENDEAQQFENSLEQRTCDGESSLEKLETLSLCSNSESQSVFNSEISCVTQSESNTCRGTKERKTKFRIPSFRPTTFNNVKSRYLEVFKKKNK